ncbi:hypothetical protein AMATHDRAFT_47021 [Amanita thiersii Skay4041]|uniref:DASH complex subunit DUO1 n=1 Tax=Amanita thiersii Skay4041 TaxID=703135 RepID=A0A2A9NV21_9AGAR|nr:hypothetical protein AMATHDRAFT_47021 [Amanita thiersii Skay4041]
MYNSSHISNFDFPPATTSNLHSQSPLYAPSTPSVTRLDDLSLSDLSIMDRPPLFIYVQGEQQPFDEDEYKSDTSAMLHVESEQEEVDSRAKRRQESQLREEKLQSDLVVLKKLNAAFASFYQALEETGSANERVAAQLGQTDALLNKYINILSRSEDISRLILDEEWQGAEADEERWEREMREAKEKARREAEEQALAEQQERERRTREEQERLEREERERMEKERQERLAARGGVRGGRGTRAPARVPSSSSGGTLGRGRAPTTKVSQTAAAGTKRGTSSSGLHSSSSGTSIRGTIRRT